MANDEKQHDIRVNVDKGSGWLWLVLFIFFPLHGCSDKVPSLADGIFYKLTDEKLWNTTEAMQQMQKEQE